MPTNLEWKEGKDRPMQSPFFLLGGEPDKMVAPPPTNAPAYNETIFKVQWRQYWFFASVGKSDG